MKSAESIDEAVQSADVALAGGDAVTASNSSTLDQRRRRLVRGAVAAAPLVLTLRSGALAAASCTGAKAVSTPLGNDGRPVNNVGQVQGDVCYKTTDVNVCPQHQLTKLENVLGVSPPSQTIDGNGKCGSYKNVNVAILSSHAATSFAR